MKLRFFSIPVGSLLLAVSALAQTQNFNVGQWFYGKNVTSDLPAGVTDLTDNMWASETHTCPIVIVSGKASLVCRDNVAGGPYTTVITEGDPMLGSGRLAIPTTPANPPAVLASPYGRYLSSTVRTGPKNLYFTSVVPSAGAPGFTQQAAFRFANYNTLQRVAGAGDTVTINRPDLGLGQPPPIKITLTGAGPMDANVDGREFIYLEAADSGIYALCELVSPGNFNILYYGRLTSTMMDSPWGMGGFTFDHTTDHVGVIFSQDHVIYRVDLKLQQSANPYPLAVQGQIFAPPEPWTPNLLLASFFRSTVDPTSFYMSWGNVPNGASLALATAPEFLQKGISPLPDGTGWTSIYQSTVGTANETTLGTFASSGNLTVAGVSPFATANNRVQGGVVGWQIQTLLYNSTPGGWTSMLTQANLPDASNGAKAFYQGVTAHGCQLEFATKKDSGAGDGGGAFYALYRLFRPCLTSATLNTTTLVVKGVNLADQSTAVYLQTPGSTAMQGPFTVISATSTEVDATVPSFTTGSQVVIVVNGGAQSDPLNVTSALKVTPVVADLTDINGQHSNPVASKLMTLVGQFACQTAQTQTVNYPLTLGNCTVNFEDGSAAPLLYTTTGQINLLLPSTLTVGAHKVTVTRTDSGGTATSAAFQFNVSAEGPVEVMNQGNVIVEVIRNGQPILMGPTNPVHPGEYFTFYVTGGNATQLPTSVTVGSVAAQFTQAFVNWAQGLLQVNVLVPPGTGTNASVRYGNAPPFNLTVQ